MFIACKEVVVIIINISISISISSSFSVRTYYLTTEHVYVKLVGYNMKTSHRHHVCNY